MIQSIASTLSLQTLRQLSPSPIRNTEPHERLTTGQRAAPPTETETNSAPVKTTSINPLVISASFDQAVAGDSAQLGKSLVQPSPGVSADRTFVDTNEDAANSRALQTRQSLSVSAISLANQQKQELLQLFR